MPSRWWIGAGVAAAVAAFVGTGALTSRGDGIGALRPGDVRVVSFNYCGNVCAAGSDEGAPFVTRLVAESAAETLVLQEVCRSQADHLRQELSQVWQQAALHYVTTFAEDFDGRNSCVDDDYGLAIIAPSIRRSWTLPLPNPGLDEGQIDERAMPCVEVSPEEPLVVCTTHLVRASNHALAHEAQADALVDHASVLAESHPDVVIVGDMNDDAERFAALTQPDGPFRGAAHRVHHAFVSRRGSEGVDLDAVPCACSDHAALVVTARHAEPR